MKQIILLIAIVYYCTCSLNTDHENRLGPAHNVEDRGEYTLSCSDYYLANNSYWLDDNPDTTFVPSDISDCVDLHL